MNVDVEQAKLSMNIFDAIVLGVFGLSSVVAFFRGFVREVLSLGAWVGAALITMYLFPQSTAFMKGHMKNEAVAAGTAALGTYLCALVTLSLINSIIIKYLKEGSEVGMLDNALGLVFGALRGAFILSLAFLILMAVQPKKREDQPAWLKTSITKPYLEEGAGVLARMAPRYLSNLEEIIQKQKDAKQKKDGEAGEDEEPRDPDATDGDQEKDPSGSMRETIHDFMNAGPKDAKEDTRDDRR